jgi:hypothetical protein
MTPVEKFATILLGKPLYPYQAAAANAILASIRQERGDILTVMMSRQSGKNQLSAIVEAFLLFTRATGEAQYSGLQSIIKAAPTFTPQIINSQRRLMSMLQTRWTSDRIWTSYGQIGLAPSADRRLLQHHVGPYVQFFSGDPDSNVVGGTASILLEIDEAQDFSSEKFDKDFRPMASTTNATSVMYGTAWTEDTLLARQKAINLELEKRDGRKRHFEYNWQACATYNPNYRKFVEAEIARLGEHSIAIQTQYLLVPVSGAGRFLTDLQRELVQGAHHWQDNPAGYGLDLRGFQHESADDGLYVAGLDVGGEERANPDDPEKVTSSKRDSSVLTIARVRWNEFGLPALDVVHQQWWTGMHHADQYAAVCVMMERWNIRRVVVDATGEGAGLASLLIDRFGEERITAFRFTRPSKSKLGFQVLTMINSGRLKLYKRQSAPARIAEETWQQLTKARYRLPAAETIDFYVAESDGHDDFLLSLALMTESVEGMPAPVAETKIIQARKLYPGESRY